MRPGSVPGMTESMPDEILQKRGFENGRKIMQQCIELRQREL